MLESRTLRFEEKTKKKHLLGVLLLLLLLFFYPALSSGPSVSHKQILCPNAQLHGEEHLRETSWRTDTCCVRKGTWGLGT